MEEEIPTGGARAAEFSAQAPHAARPRILVIGAGSSGLTTLKTLRQRGLRPICFEMGHDLGGLWAFENSNQRGGSYRSLHINTSRRAMQYSDFPMPEDIGDFPHRKRIFDYFHSYSQRFDLGSAIRFDTEVLRCVPFSPSGYKVIAYDKKADRQFSEVFDAVIVANGHHFWPSFPTPFPARGFNGHILHSAHYIDPTSPLPLKGRRVVVVGMGNSAMDIACELSREGSDVTVSARRGAWILPKYLRGRPIDEGAIFPYWLPSRLRRILVTKSFELIYGRMTDFGLPQPDHLLGEAHPTVSTEFPPLVASGDIRVQKSITHCEGSRVVFSDGKSQEADAIIFCTGYQVRFPFFHPSHLAADENDLPLYFRTFHPEHRHVFFVGLLQTIGAVMPVAEAQARAVAAHLTGDYNLPSTAEMEKEIERSRREMKERFFPSLRHTMQVIPEQFHPSLRRELARGHKRAKRALGLGFKATSD